MVPYVPPSWAHALPAPSHRILLAAVPTPIHAWKLSGLPQGISLVIKRDDLTGSALTGNKVRKLEFILADALRRGATTLITCGGSQSNHARATAVAARELGMDTHMVLRSNVPELELTGNLFLDTLTRARVHLVGGRAPYVSAILPKMQEIEAKLKEEGKVPYVVPVGGSDPLIGIWGYLDAWEEMIKQGVLDKVDDIVLACGSGGTLAGLVIANYLTESKVRIHGFPVSDNAQYFFSHIDSTLQALRLPVKASEIVSFVDGYKGEGYAISKPEHLAFIAEVAGTTGIFLDPVYTGKACFGLVQELNSPPATRQLQLKGTRVMFLHTGGLIGLMDGTVQQTLVSPVVVVPTVVPAAVQT